MYLKGMEEPIMVIMLVKVIHGAGIGKWHNATLHPMPHQNVKTWQFAINATLDDGRTGFVRRIQAPKQMMLHFMETPEFGFVEEHN